jgi:hypothetical protein
MCPSERTQWHDNLRHAAGRGPRGQLPLALPPAVCWKAALPQHFTRLSFVASGGRVLYAQPERSRTELDRRPRGRIGSRA